MQLTPQSAGLGAGGQTQISVYLDTDSVLGYLSSNPAPVRKDTRVAWVAIVPLLWLARRRRIRDIVALAVCGLVLSSVWGCGDGTAPSSTAPGSYQIPITAVGQPNGISHTLNIPLTVTQ